MTFSKEDLKQLPEWALWLDPDETLQLIEDLLQYEQNDEVFREGDLDYHSGKLIKILQDLDERELVKQRGQYYTTTKLTNGQLNRVKEDLEQAIDNNDESEQ